MRYQELTPSLDLHHRAEQLVIGETKEEEKSETLPAVDRTPAKWLSKIQPSPSTSKTSRPLRDH